MRTRFPLLLASLAAALLAVPRASRPADAPAPAAVDPAHPHRTHGAHPSSRSPDETREYIELLERPDRAAWQKPDEVVKALGLRGTETLEDVGAGSGYFTFRFARALPRGRVIATDIDPAMVRHIQRRASAEGVLNVKAVVAPPHDPSIAPEVDVVFIADVVHHVENPDAWLRKLREQMKPGAGLVVIEFKEGELPLGPPDSMKIPRARLVAMIERAGLKLVSEEPDLLPYQVFLRFEKPAAAGR